MTIRRAVRGILVAIPVVLVAAFGVSYVTSTNACADPATFQPQTPMLAIAYCEFGGPEVLRIATVEKPAIDDNQLLIKVRAAGLNPVEWHYVRGTPYLARFEFGLRVPKSIRLGVDYSGVVEAVGRNVTAFRVGDEVFGGRNGALAEYIAASKDGAVVRKPAAVTFEQAGGVGVAGITALQAVRDQARVERGHKVLINGASGGVGTFAVQIAKAWGAEVTGVQSTRNLDLVRALGADHVVDYTKEDFTASAERYDAIIDMVGNRSLSEVRRVLKPEGRYVLIGGGGPDDNRWGAGLVGRLLQMVLVSPFTDQQVGFFVSSMNQKDMTVLGDLMKDGRVTPVLDRQYPFEKTAEALRHLETGRARGKVVVTFETTKDS